MQSKICELPNPQNTPVKIWGLHFTDVSETLDKLYVNFEDVLLKLKSYKIYRVWFH